MPVGKGSINRVTKAVESQIIEVVEAATKETEAMVNLKETAVEEVQVEKTKVVKKTPAKKRATTTTTLAKKTAAKKTTTTKKIVEPEKVEKVVKKNCVLLGEDMPVYLL